MLPPVLVQRTCALGQGNPRRAQGLTEENPGGRRDPVIRVRTAGPGRQGSPAPSLAPRVHWGLGPCCGHVVGGTIPHWVIIVGKDNREPQNVMLTSLLTKIKNKQRSSL